ncbi:MAG: hypothetical protein V1814_01225 [Candidatus Moraniibacteriota bacterium]
MEKSKKIILVLVVALFLMIIIGIIFKMVAPKGELDGSVKNNKSAASESQLYSDRLFELEKNIDNEKNIDKVREMEREVREITHAPSSAAEEAQGKLLLARIFIYRYANSQSVVQGIDLIREVAKNEKYSKLWRSVAYDYMANSFRDVVDDDYLVSIWSDDYFKPLKDKEYPEVGTIKNVCNASFDLYPLPLCSYRIAAFDLARLIEDKSSHNLNDAKRAQYLEDAKEKIAAGDAVTSKYPFPYLNIFNKGKILLMQASRQTELYLLGQVSKDFAGEAERKYKESVVIFNSGRALPDQEEGFITYWYACFLAEVYGDERIDDIIKLTDQLVERYNKNRTKPFFLYMKKLNAMPGTNNNELVTMGTALLSQKNPRFKAVMKELGWTEERLNTPFPKLP